MYAKVPSCPALDEKTRQNLTRRLFNLGSLNFSGVQLKTGEVSPVYFDIRLVMSDTALLDDIARLMYTAIRHSVGNKFDLVTGVPAAAVGLATQVAVQNSIPMILTRKAVKDYGTKKMIEGIWRQGQNVLVVEDVVTYGDSISETTALLRGNGLMVEHAVVVVERQQGATENLLKNHKVKLHALLTLDDILNFLVTDGLIPPERVLVAHEFIASAQYDRVKGKSSEFIPSFCPNIAHRLTEVIRRKGTNVCLSIDTPVSTTELLLLAEQVGPNVAVLELDHDLLTDTDSALPMKLRVLAEKHNFLLLDDCKMSDDNWVAQLKLSDKCHHKLCDWADLISVHALPGPGALSALRSFNVSSSRQIAALIIYDMQTKGSLTDSHYQERCLQMARAYQDVVLGFVTSSPIDAISYKLNSEETPNVFYKTPSQHNPSPVASTNGDGCKATLDASKAFCTCAEGVIHTVNLSTLGGCVELPSLDSTNRWTLFSKSINSPS